MSGAPIELGLTFPLQRKLRVKAPPCGGPSNRRRCWDLHCISLHGRESLLMVHCSSRYTVTVFNLTQADWVRLPDFALEQLRLGLLNAGLPPATVDRYLRSSESPRLTRTHGRREVAFLNRAWEDVTALDHAVDQSRQVQPLLDHAVNDRPCHCAGHTGLGRAGAFLRLDLC